MGQQTLSNTGNHRAATRTLQTRSPRGSQKCLQPPAREAHGCIPFIPFTQPDKAIQMRQEDYWYSRAGPKSLRNHMALSHSWPHRL